MNLAFGLWYHSLVSEKWQRSKYYIPVIKAIFNNSFINVKRDVVVPRIFTFFFLWQSVIVLDILKYQSRGWRLMQLSDLPWFLIIGMVLPQAIFLSTSLHHRCPNCPDRHGSFEPCQRHDKSKSKSRGCSRQSFAFLVSSLADVLTPSLQVSWQSCGADVCSSCCLCIWKCLSKC